MSMTMIWTIIIVFSVIIEAITINLVSIWFVIGAALAIIADQFHISLFYQLLIFIISSILIIIMTRPLAKKYLRGRITKTNLDRIIGKHCLIIKTITPDTKGEVKINGHIWSATSLNNDLIEEGEYGEIVSIEGAHVVVRKLEKKEGILC